MFTELSALSQPESLWLNLAGLIGFAAFALWAAFGVCGGGPGAKLYRITLNQPWSAYCIGLAVTNGASR
jgi:hypothetical protein